MATNTLAVVPSAVHSVAPAVKCLRVNVDFADTSNATKLYTLGTIPANSVVLRGEVVVSTAFNYGTNNLMDIGVAGTTNNFSASLSLTTIGVITFASMATATKIFSTSDVVIQAQMQCTGTAATAGHCIVVLEYVEDLGSTSG